MQKHTTCIFSKQTILMRNSLSIPEKSHLAYGTRERLNFLLETRLKAGQNPMLMYSFEILKKPSQVSACCKIRSR